MESCVTRYSEPAIYCMPLPALTPKAWPEVLVVAPEEAVQQLGDVLMVHVHTHLSQAPVHTQTHTYIYTYTVFARDTSVHILQREGEAGNGDTSYTP